MSIVIVGATGGIGRALVAELRGHGPLFLTGRDEAAARALADEVGGEGGALDARDPAAVDAWMERAKQAGPIRGVVNLAGSILLKPLARTTDAEFAETLGQNLMTAFHVARAAARTMTDGGSVVLVSTGAAAVGLPNHEAIAAAKAGIEGLVRSAAATYAAKGLRFNAVAPGLVDTPLAARLTKSEAALKASVALHPAGRIGQPGDVARVIALLLDPRNTWITGQVIGVDGGLSRLKVGG